MNCGVALAGSLCTFQNKEEEEKRQTRKPVSDASQGSAGFHLRGSWGKPDCLGDQQQQQKGFSSAVLSWVSQLGVNCGCRVEEGGKTRKRGSSQLVATQTGITLLCKHPSASETEDVEPSGAVWLDDHCYLWVGDEVGQVGGDDEGGEGVLGVGPVPPLLLLLDIARKEQARHTAGYQVMHDFFYKTLSS